MNSVAAMSLFSLTKMSLPSVLQQYRSILLLHPLDLTLEVVTEFIRDEFQEPVVVGEANVVSMMTYGEFLMAEKVIGTTDTGETVAMVSSQPYSELVSNRVILFTSLTDALGFLDPGLFSSLQARGNHLIFLATLGVTQVEYNRLSVLLPDTIPLYIGTCDPVAASSGIQIRVMIPETSEETVEGGDMLMPLAMYPRLNALIRDIMTKNDEKHLVLTGAHLMLIKRGLQFFGINAYINSIDEFNQASSGVYLSRMYPDGLREISHLHFYDPNHDALFVAGQVYQNQTCYIDGRGSTLDVVLHISDDNDEAAYHAKRVMLDLTRAVEVWEYLLQITPRVILS